MAAQNMSTCLVIRAPNQKFGDQQVNCPLDWSVQQLKQHLSMVYPNNPRPEDQKLIYSGQLLEDEMTLKDVFQMDFGKIHILHLVCRSAGDTPEASSPSVPLAAISQPDISMAGGSVSTVPSTSSVSSASSDGLRHRSISPGAMPNGQMPIALGMPPGTSSPEQLVQQVALAQQLYAHYFTQYMHLMHQAAAPVAGQAGAPRPPSPEAETPAAAAAAAPPVVRAAQDNRGPRMNAQGGPLLDEEEEEAAQRDWLDWVYTVSRATVLLSIVYFYSSFGRFLVVTGVALLMYLYQGGWFAAPRQQQLPEREHDRNRAREADNQQHQAGRLADEPREMPQFSAAAWFAAVQTMALAASRYVPVAPGGVLTAGVAARNVGSSSYTATGVLHMAESSPPEGTSRRRAAPRGGALEKAGDFGVSYIGSPPDSEETAVWTDLVVTKLRMQTKPSLGFEPRPARGRRPPAAPARKRPLHVPRFATAASSGSVSRSARAKSPRFTYLKTVSYTTFPYYGFGYGPYGFGYSWKPYRPWGMMYGAMGRF